MIKKLMVLFFLFGAIVLVSAYAFAEDTASATDMAELEEDNIPAEEGVGEGVITGEVTVLDITTGSITVKGDDSAEKVFSVVDGETILWKGIEDITLADIKKGDKAEVGYYTSDAGKLVASWVDVLIPEPFAATDAQTVPAVPETSDEE
jgi:hypothetical protein